MPPGTGGAAPAASAVRPHGIAMPNQTVYINNLNDKISKDLLRRELYVLCSQFGNVLDVVALKTPKMRGQAFVVFQHLTAASTALSKLQGFEFYGKQMRTSYCKTKSDAVAKEDGTFVPRHKRKADAAGPAAKQPVAKKAAGEAAGEVAKAAPAERKEEKEEMDTDEEPPNKILFLEHLPAEINDVMLKALFKQFPGLTEVRMVPGKVGIGFVEFETEGQSSVAKETLQGFKLTPTNSMKITFAKKM
mmetsp:Transcript_38920/g.95764  ORF Transcript_38920/g.95764 Transcript_38920/m.95764 type:complete len:247 (+) Transcript_38920:94-834(+)